jgi:hypothetical protein
MKIVTYLLGALLVAALGAAALFYFATFAPMLADYNKLKAGLPELDKARTELKKCRERAAAEAGKTEWISPIVTELSAALSDEIKAGTAEVSATENGVVINISEDVIYTPHSVTFAGKDREAFLKKLAAALGNKDLKGKTIILGNTTDAAPAQGRGAKKIPPKEARALAVDRSLQLVKFLERNKVDSEALVAAGYAAKTRDTGFKIKDHKTVILITKDPAPAAPSGKQEQPPAASQAAPQTIPLKPTQPNAQ